ncbi:MAG: insulinase family protein [Bacteroidia bacterium]|nr:insulinase family protein [Bacteroidia bacterium]
MKSLQTISLLLVLLLLARVGQAQKNPAKLNTNSASRTYESVPNDPLKARIYTLDNGLKVYLTVNKNEPRIQTCIPIKAGSKNDPSDATGLAHYLEHMLFKGTDQYGTLDFAKEKPLLTQIEDLYETYRATTDEAKRKEIYAEIDRVSGEAAKYAIANEYDKMLAAIGATGTNAYTSNEQTVYINEIPSNQLESWLKIEGERFRNPQYRLFHTELEAVYEEKNISLDRDGSKAWETMFANIFPTHNYGQQTTIGTIEHLKNPSIKKIKAYYEANYVPNNMAICLSGDLDPDQTIAWVEKYFGYMQPKEVAPYKVPVESPIVGPIEQTVTGPDAESMMIGFRFPGVKSREAKVLQIIDMILSNSSAGLIDLNINQQQKALGAGSFAYQLNDYGIHILSGRPREGQSLEEVRDLLLEQINIIKRGEFDFDLLPAIVNNLEIEQMQDYERNYSRASAFVDAFTSNLDWKDYVSEIDELRQIDAAEIIEVAKKFYQDNNYVVVYKRTGERPNTVKVVKPAITPVEVNREAQSPFLLSIIETEAPKIAPVFLDYKKDIKFEKFANGVPLHYVKNQENGLFTLYFLLDMGTNHDKNLAHAIEYLPYLGTDKYTPEEIQKKFFALGSSFNVNSSSRQVYVYLNGLQSNFEASLQLFEHLLANAKPDEEALQNMIQGTLKSRENDKLSKFRILRSAMNAYATYGKSNPFNDVLSNDELKALKGADLVKIIKSLTHYDHRVLYYGPGELSAVKNTLAKYHNAKDKVMPLPAPRSYSFQSTEKPKIYFVEYDMVQAEIMWLSKSIDYNAELTPQVTLFNEYYGGNMSSIVFQTIRESKALAYSSRSSFNTPYAKGEPYYLTAYIGTQADKLHEAIAGMNELLEEMPLSENLFQGSKTAILNRLETERTTRTSILFSYENAMRKGLDYDLNRMIYTEVPKMNFDQVKQFHQTYISGKPHTLLILGSKNNIDLKSLQQYGDVTELTLEQIFGY